MGVDGLMRGSEPALQVGCWRWGDRGLWKLPPLSSLEQAEAKAGVCEASLFSFQPVWGGGVTICGGGGWHV